MIRKLHVVLALIIAFATPAAAQLVGPVLPEFGVTPPGVTPRQFCGVPALDKVMLGKESFKDV